MDFTDAELNMVHDALITQRDLHNTYGERSKDEARAATQFALADVAQHLAARFDRRIESRKNPKTVYVQHVTCLGECLEQTCTKEEYDVLNAKYDRPRGVDIDAETNTTTYWIENFERVVCGLCSLDLTDAEIDKGACHQACIDADNDASNWHSD